MTKEYLMNRLTDYCEKVGNKVMMSVEDVISILNEDTDIRYKIHNEIERENHKEDVRTEIKERELDLTNEDIECITDKYEDYLDFVKANPSLITTEMDTVYNDITNGPFIQTFNWRVCLENAIDEFLG